MSMVTTAKHISLEKKLQYAQNIGTIYIYIYIHCIYLFKTTLVYIYKA